MTIIYLQDDLSEEQTTELLNASELAVDTELTGLDVPLCTTKQTAHEIALKNNGIICYASLVVGQSLNEISINFDGATYHTVK